MSTSDFFDIIIARISGREYKSSVRLENGLLKTAHGGLIYLSGQGIEYPTMQWPPFIFLTDEAVFRSVTDPYLILMVSEQIKRMKSCDYIGENHPILTTEMKEYLKDSMGVEFRESHQSDYRFTIELLGKGSNYTIAREHGLVQIRTAYKN